MTRTIADRRLALGLLGPIVAAGFTAYSLHRTGVGFHVQATYGVYLLLGLVLPGLVMWRGIFTRTSTLLADVVAGTSLAYATELAVYLVCAHLDHPGVARVWPALPLLALVHPALRRRVWRRAARSNPPWVTWALSGAIVYAVATTSQSLWSQFPLTGKLARSPYIDVPYHLSLIGALSRHVPVDIPAVAGQPLYYHWFFHADTAAAGHATGIDLLILLTRLGPLALMVLIFLGVAVVVERLTGSAAAGVVAVAIACGASSAPYVVGLNVNLLSGYLFLSPTTAFAIALLVAPTFILFDVFDTDRVLPWAAWPALLVSICGLSGAKGSMLPVVLGGLASVLVMDVVLRRRLHPRLVAVLAMTVVVFELAQHYVYGGSSQGTSVKLFGYGDLMATRLDLAVGSVSLGLAIALTLANLLAIIPLWAGLAGLFGKDTWKDSRAHFLVGFTLAAAGAVIALDNSGFNQIYFLRVAPTLIAVGGVWGLVVLARRIDRPAARDMVVAGAAIGGVTGSVALATFGATTSTSSARVILPPVVVVAICIVAGTIVGLRIAARRTVTPRRVAGLLTVTAALSVLGLPAAVQASAKMVVQPAKLYTALPLKPPRLIEIGGGGIAAARWLRDHSKATDLVATNLHCLFPHMSVCDHRTTWISGFTERQVLVEGWAYTSRSAADAAKQGVPTAYVNFWNPSLLRANDLAFSRPTPAREQVLRDRYGVRWLFVDEREPADLPGLRQVATERFHFGLYTVFELTPRAGRDPAR